MLEDVEDKAHRLEVIKKGLEGDNQRMLVVVNERESEIKVSSIYCVSIATTVGCVYEYFPLLSQQGSYLFNQ